MSKRHANFEGNTNSKLSRQDVQRLYYCFTFFYLNETEIELLEINLKRISIYYVFGKEKTKQDKPHLQGFMQLDKKRRFSQVIKLLPGGIHLEVCKSGEKDNINYCKKDNDYVEWHNPAVVGNTGSSYVLNEDENIVMNNILSGNGVINLCSQSDNFMVNLYTAHKCGFFLIKDVSSLKHLGRMNNRLIVISFFFTLNADEILGIRGIIERGHFNGTTFTKRYIIFE